MVDGVTGCNVQMERCAPMMLEDVAAVAGARKSCRVPTAIILRCLEMQCVCRKSMEEEEIATVSKGRKKASVLSPETLKYGWEYGLAVVNEEVACW
jgi:hypothetical protein